MMCESEGQTFSAGAKALGYRIFESHTKESFVSLEFLATFLIVSSNAYVNRKVFLVSWIHGRYNRASSTKIRASICGVSKLA